jgi:hypothetical protein
MATAMVCAEKPKPNASRCRTELRKRQQDKLRRARRKQLRRRRLLEPLEQTVRRRVKAMRCWSHWRQRVSEQDLAQRTASKFEVSVSTIRQWEGLYRQGGLEALLPKPPGPLPSHTYHSRARCSGIYRCTQGHPDLAWSSAPAEGNSASVDHPLLSRTQWQGKSFPQDRQMRVPQPVLCDARRVGAGPGSIRGLLQPLPSAQQLGLSTARHSLSGCTRRPQPWIGWPPVLARWRPLTLRLSNSDLRWYQSVVKDPLELHPVSASTVRF